MTVVYTIGYQGSDIDRFVATLKAAGVRTLADIRAIANSRKKGFSKSALQARLATEGIGYVHLAELGNPKPGRDAAYAGRLDEYRKIYLAHLESETAQAALRELSRIAEDATTCLLCFERDPAACHRSIVADRLAANGMERLDLDGSEPDS